MKINPKSQVELYPRSQDPYVTQSDAEMIKIVKVIEIHFKNSECFIMIVAKKQC